MGFWWRNPEGKRPAGRPKHRWVDNIKMDLRELGWGCIDFDSSDLGQEPVEGSCEHDNEPSGSTKCWEILE
jgi:hypothetical protein